MKHFLIAVDLQNDFVDGSLGTCEAENIIDNAAKKIESFDGYVFATLDTHYQNYLDTPEGKKLPVKHCIKNTKGWELNSRVKHALMKKEHTLVEKNTFGSVNLPHIIERSTEGDYFDITLIGLCTDICVISNAVVLKAHFPDNDIFVDAACCAGVTVSSHEKALDIMNSCQINILNR